MTILTILAIGVLAPIPLVHIILHSLLDFWRKNIKAFYIVSALVWPLCFLIGWELSRFDQMLYYPPSRYVDISIILAAVGLVLPFWSALTIGAKRFFHDAAQCPHGNLEDFVALHLDFGFPVIFFSGVPTHGNAGVRGQQVNIIAIGMDVAGEYSRFFRSFQDNRACTIGKKNCSIPLVPVGDLRQGFRTADQDLLCITAANVLVSDIQRIEES